MKELIKIDVNKKGQKLVDARELYDFLEIKTEFKDWFKRMLKYGFEEGIDFSSYLSKSNGGRPSKEYAIKLDMAKELSMIQRTEKGKQARKYFIECEKQLKEVMPILTAEEKLQLAILKANTKDEVILASSELDRFRKGQILELEEKIEEDEPLVELARKRLDGNGLLSITDTTKTFELKKGKITKWAKNNGYLHKTSTEVNKIGEEYFRVYDAKGFKCIGINENGLKLINEHLDEIKAS